MWTRTWGRVGIWTGITCWTGITSSWTQFIWVFCRSMCIGARNWSSSTWYCVACRTNSTGNWISGIGISTSWTVYWLYCISWTKCANRAGCTSATAIGWVFSISSRCWWGCSRATVTSRAFSAHSVSWIRVFSCCTGSCYTCNITCRSFWANLKIIKQRFIEISYCSLSLRGSWVVSILTNFWFCINSWAVEARRTICAACLSSNRVGSCCAFCFSGGGWAFVSCRALDAFTILIKESWHSLTYWAPASE